MVHLQFDQIRMGGNGKKNPSISQLLRPVEQSTLIRLLESTWLRRFWSAVAEVVHKYGGWFLLIRHVAWW
jgi:hypothetical protein